MKENAIITGKEIKLAKQCMNTETRSITGALKIIATVDNKDEYLRKAIKLLGNISTSAHRIEVAKRLFESTPYYTERNGERLPVDRTRIKCEDGTTRVAYKLRTTWSPAKILNGLKCYVGESKCTHIPSDQVEE
jgi:hypothetical protein